MKLDWQDYPLGLFTAAARSTVGGIVTLMVSLCLGTQLGYLALEGDIYSPTCTEDWLALVFSFLFPICASCIQIWGFLYAALVAWFGYLLINQDAPRLRTGAFIVFPQFVCTVITIGFMEHFDKELLLRLTVATPLVAALSATPWFFTWLRRRNITEASA
jgi:hypothetical protein